MSFDINRVSLPVMAQVSPISHTSPLQDDDWARTVRDIMHRCEMRELWWRWLEEDFEGDSSFNGEGTDEEGEEGEEKYEGFDVEDGSEA